jgi:hypothetical protein
MRKLTFALLIAALALPLAARAETWSNVSMVDKNCSGKVKDKPDSHTRECALKCAGSGFGVVAADGKFIPFDRAGNDLAVAALKGTRKSDHLRVNVTGALKDGTIAVASLAMAD